MAKKKITKKVTTEITEEVIKTNEKTHIICILDGSSSMTGIIDESISAFNAFLKEQKELPDEATITVAIFNSPHNYKVLYDNINIKNAEELDRTVWSPQGMTALYDAIGKTIKKDKEKLKKLGDKAPDKVLVCIVTDGEENCSRKYKLEDIKKLIKKREKKDWNFMYLAANQDAFQVGTSFGVSAGNTYTYEANTKGVMDMTQKLSYATTNYRGMSKDSVTFASSAKDLLSEDNDKEN